MTTNPVRPSSLRITVALLIAGISLVYLSYISLHRFLAADEGYYLLAARLVLEGSALYRDFFFPQMPLFPYLYAGWGALTSTEWESFRLLSAFLSAGIAFTAYQITSRIGGLWIGIFSAFLVLSNGLFLGWFPICKSYSLAGCFLILAFFALSRIDEKNAPNWWFGAAGVLIGLAVNVRLFYAGLIPLTAFLLWWRRGPRPLLWFLGCGTLTALPHLVFVFMDFEAYWFGNMGYHLERAHRPLSVDLESKQRIVSALLGFSSFERVDGLQFPLLFYTALIGLSAWFVKTKECLPLLLLSWCLSLFLLYLIPRPTHLQYYATLTPYLALGTGLTVWRTSRASPRLAAAVAVLVLVAHTASTPQALSRFLWTGEGVKGIEEQYREMARIEVAKEVSTELREAFPSRAVVLSQWPGYLLETDLQPYPGAENQFWTRIGHKLSESERERYHLVSLQEFQAAVSDLNTAGVVIEEQKRRRYFQGKLLEDAGFVLHRSINGVQIYKRKESEPT